MTAQLVTLRVDRQSTSMQCEVLGEDSFNMRVRPEDIRLLREKASEIRATAAETRDLAAKTTLMEVAAGYDWLADDTEVLLHPLPVAA
jgi:hypothetical protein